MAAIDGAPATGARTGSSGGAEDEAAGGGGVGDGGSGAGAPGAAAVEGDEAANAWPQLLQNFASGAQPAPQAGHGMDVEPA